MVILRNVCPGVLPASGCWRRLVVHHTLKKGSAAVPMSSTLRLLLPILLCLVPTTFIKSSSSRSHAFLTTGMVAAAPRQHDGSLSLFTPLPPPSLGFFRNVHGKKRNIDNCNNCNLFHLYHRHHWQVRHDGGDGIVTIFRPTSVATSKLSFSSRHQHHHEEQKSLQLRQHHSSGRRWKGRYDQTKTHILHI